MSLIRNALLTLTTVRPAYGLQLRGELERRLQRTLNSGQIYTTLERLERDQLIGRDGQTPDGLAMYTATPAGRQLVADWLVTPYPDFDHMCQQLLFVASLPGLNLPPLLAAYSTQLSQLERQYLHRIESLAADTADASQHFERIAIDAQLRFVQTAMAWVSSLTAEPPTPFELSTERPKRGRPGQQQS